jgi:hypothetical protein
MFSRFVKLSNSIGIILQFFLFSLHLSQFLDFCAHGGKGVACPFSHDDGKQISFGYPNTVEAT